MFARQPPAPLLHHLRSFCYCSWCTPRVGAYCIWAKSAAGHLAAHDGVLHPVRHICMHTTGYVREWNTDTREPRLHGGVGTHTDTKTRNRSARHPSGQEPVVGPATPPVMSPCGHTPMGRQPSIPHAKKGIHGTHSPHPIATTLATDQVRPITRTPDSMAPSSRCPALSLGRNEGRAGAHLAHGGCEHEEHGAHNGGGKRGGTGHDDRVEREERAGGF